MRTKNGMKRVFAAVLSLVVMVASCLGAVPAREVQASEGAAYTELGFADWNIPFGNVEATALYTLQDTAVTSLDGTAISGTIKASGQSVFYIGDKDNGGWGGIMVNVDNSWEVISIKSEVADCKTDAVSITKAEIQSALGNAGFSLKDEFALRITFDVYGENNLELNVYVNNVFVKTVQFANGLAAKLGTDILIYKANGDLTVGDATAYQELSFSDWGVPTGVYTESSGNYSPTAASVTSMDGVAFSGTLTVTGKSVLYMGVKEGWTGIQVYISAEGEYITIESTPFANYTKIKETILVSEIQEALGDDTFTLNNQAFSLRLTFDIYGENNVRVHAYINDTYMKTANFNNGIVADMGTALVVYKQSGDLTLGEISSYTELSLSDWSIPTGDFAGESGPYYLSNSTITSMDGVALSGTLSVTDGVVALYVGGKGGAWNGIMLYFDGSTNSFLIESTETSTYTKVSANIGELLGDTGFSVQNAFDLRLTFKYYGENHILLGVYVNDSLVTTMDFNNGMAATMGTEIVVYEASGSLYIPGDETVEPEEEERVSGPLVVDYRSDGGETSANCTGGVYFTTEDTSFVTAKGQAITAVSGSGKVLYNGEQTSSYSLSLAYGTDVVPGLYRFWYTGGTVEAGDSLTIRGKFTDGSQEITFEETTFVYQGATGYNNNGWWALGEINDLTIQLENGAMSVKKTGTLSAADLADVVKTEVTSIQIEAGVNEIAAGTFDGYSNLTEIYLPNTVNKVAEDAFVNCPEGVVLRYAVGHEFTGGLVNPDIHPYYSFKTVTIGSSYGEDMNTYVYKLAKTYFASIEGRAEGDSDYDEIVIAELFTGGGTLAQRVNAIMGSPNASCYYEKWDKNGISIPTSPNGQLSAELMGMALGDEYWDIVILMQSADDSAKPASFETKTNGTDADMDVVIAFAKENNKNDANSKYYWLQTWSYNYMLNDSDFERACSYAETMRQNIVTSMTTSVQARIDSGALDGIIPAGAGLENLKGSCINVADADFDYNGKSASGLYNNGEWSSLFAIQRDTAHASSGLGRFTLGLTVFSYMAGLDDAEIAKLSATCYPKNLAEYEISDKLASEQSATGAYLGYEEATKGAAPLAAKAAVAALANPYEITLTSEHSYESGTCAYCSEKDQNYTEPENPDGDTPGGDTTVPGGNTSGGNSGNGGTTQETVKKPKGTTIKKLTAGKKKITVKWKAQKKDMNGYEIQYSLKKNFKAAKIKSVSKKKTSVTIKKLKAKKTYYVRIRTYKTVKQNGKNVKVYSSWSKAKKVKVKK